MTGAPVGFSLSGSGSFFEVVRLSSGVVVGTARYLGPGGSTDWDWQAIHFDVLPLPYRSTRAGMSKRTLKGAVGWIVRRELDWRFGSAFD